MVLKSFVLVGTIMSHDSFFATVEFDLNPSVNGGPSIAVLPMSAIPCPVEDGNKIYVVKNEKEEHSTISCERNQ